MTEFSWELLIHCFVIHVTEQWQCQPEWEQMEISVTQASNSAFSQSVSICVISPSDAVGLESLLFWSSCPKKSACSSGSISPFVFQSEETSQPQPRRPSTGGQALQSKVPVAQSKSLLASSGYFRCTWNMRITWLHVMMLHRNLRTFRCHSLSTLEWSSHRNGSCGI